MNTFFPSTISQWNKFDLSILNSTSVNMFKSILLQFVKSLESCVCTWHYPIRITYLTRLGLGFSHLCYHKFKHGFLDAVNLLCSCSTTIMRTWKHCSLLPSRSHFSTAWNAFMKSQLLIHHLLIKIKSKIFKLSWSNFFCQW